MKASELIAVLKDMIKRDGDREVYDSDNELIDEVTFEQNERDGECFILFSEGDLH